MSASARKLPPSPSLSAEPLGRGARPVLADHEDRAGARLRLECNVVVEAGAGTGKTTLLTDRALFLLLGAGVPVAELVALTFTEKAAGEIRARLSDRLVELLAFWQGGSASEEARERCAALTEELKLHFRTGPDAAKARARSAIEDMDKAMIGTLHGFAARLLRAYPLQAGMDPAFQVDDGGLIDELFESEWAAWLDAELGERAPREREWVAMLRAASLESVEALARGLCHPRVDLDRALEPPKGMADWLRETLDILESEPRRQPPARGNIRERLQAVSLRLRRLLGAIDTGETGESDRAGDPLEPLPGAEGKDYDLSSGAGRIIPLGAGWPKGWDDEHRDRCEQAGRMAECASPESEALVRRAAELVLPFCRAFRRTLARRGFVSFDGLLVAARNLVRDHPDVREELKRKYRAFLVDEFQDTDPLQGELLFYLAERRGKCAAAWRDAALEPGKLFVVGDPKQSIYRFRGADLAAYERFVGHMTGRDPKALFCALTVNFRSEEGILSQVNGVFERMMVYATGSQPAYRSIQSGRVSVQPQATGLRSPRTERKQTQARREGEGRMPVAVELPERIRDSQEGAGMRAGVDIVMIGAEGEKEKLSVDAVRRLEAEWIARWIEEHRGRAYALKEIAVLLRTTTPLGAYLEVFKEAGIPYVVEAERYFYGTQEVLDFLNLLKALDDPENRIALAGLLRSPLVGLSDAELARLAASGGLDYRKAAGANERARRFYAELRGLRAKVGRAPLGELMEAVRERTQIVELLSAAYHGQQTVSNLTKMIRLANEASVARGLTLKGFIRRVSRDAAQSREEGESPLADEHLDAVRILTVHKAKGLEYPVVILPNLAGLSRGSGERPAVRLDWDGAGAGLSVPSAAVSAAALYLEHREGGRERDEAVRLLYVAMTRAKDRLILVGARSPGAGSFASRLAGIGAWPDVEGARVETIAARTSKERRRSAEGIEEGSGIKDLDSLARLWRERAARRDAAAAKPRHTSPSAMNEEARMRRPADEPDASRPSSAKLLGQACHRTLERWDFLGKGDLSGEIAAACGPLARRWPQEDWDALRDQCRDVLSKFLASSVAKDMAQAEILGRELPFIHAEDGAVVRGTIDLLYRSKGKLWVADYKTDQVSGAGLDAAARRYAGQARAYARAVRRSMGVENVICSLIFLRAGKAVTLE